MQVVKSAEAKSKSQSVVQSFANNVTLIAKQIKVNQDGTTWSQTSSCMSYKFQFLGAQTIQLHEHTSTDLPAPDSTFQHAFKMFQLP